MAFEKGKSGNPGGRPTHRLADGRTIGEVARSVAEGAIKTLVEICKDTQAPTAARVSAATAILDRGFGKATQPISGDDEMPPIEHAIDFSKLSAGALREIVGAS